MLMMRSAAAVATSIIAGVSTMVAGCGDTDDPILSGVMGVNAEVGPIRLLSVHVDAPPRPRYLPGEDARVWLTLLNSGTKPDTLVQVVSPAAEDVEIHWDPDCDGRFDTVPTLPLAPAEPALRDLRSGAVPFDAYHLRMVDFTQEVLAGTNLEMTFHFQHAGEVAVRPYVQPHDTRRAEPSTRCAMST